jgi:MFS family permease
MFAGGTLGMILAGVIGTYLGWRVCFFIVGVPGFVLALLSWKIDEKREPHEFQVLIKKKSVSSIFKLSPYITMLIGGILLTFTSGSIISWITVFIIRYHNFTVAEASVSIGSIVLVAGLVGIFTGGFLADKLFAKGIPRSLIISLGFFLATPLLLLIINTKTGWLLLTSMFLATFLMAWYYGPVVALIQDIVPSNLKATAYAFYLFFVHLLGDTFSPSVIGRISDASSLQTALYLPIATNFLGAMFFLLTTKLMKNFKKLNFKKNPA